MRVPEGSDRPSRMPVRPTKWAREDLKVFVPGVPTLIPSNLDRNELEALLKEITQKLQSGMADLEVAEDRGPSPPPLYDSNGKRINTKEQRSKDKMMRERHLLIQQALKMYPMFKPPSDYRPMFLKKTRKIYVPVHKYPEYNFIGLIIGPRGLTQKQMEKETGAKIAIRGKGSVKDGKVYLQGKNDPRLLADIDDDLHVLITGDTEESVSRAAELVQKLLVPVDEGKNDHKRQQLRKLAEINGTLRDTVWKRDRDSEGAAPWASIQCSICGESSHPTRDCPMRGRPVGERSKLDDEFESFLSEIGTGPDGNRQSSPGGQQDVGGRPANPYGPPPGAYPPGAYPPAGPPPGTHAGMPYPPPGDQGYGWAWPPPPGQMPQAPPPPGYYPPPPGWDQQYPPGQ